MNEQASSDLIMFQYRMQKSNNYVTNALLILIAVFFLLEELWGGSSYSPTLVRMGANAKDLVEKGEYWRLLTSVFLHGGYLHVFFNGYALVVLGMFVNRVFGNWQFFNLFILSGLIGSVASLGIGHATLSVGASGALWGLFGASAALSVLPSRLLPEVIRLRIRKITLINLAINIAISFWPMIDMWAHFGGGIAGFFIGVFYVHYVEKENSVDKQIFLHRFFTYPLSILLLITLICSFALAFSTQKPWRLKQPLTFIYETVEATSLHIAVPTLLKTKVIEKQYDTTLFQFGDLPMDPISISGFEKQLEYNLPLSSAKDILLDLIQKELRSRYLKSANKPEIINSSDFVGVKVDYVLKNNLSVFSYYQIKEMRLVQVKVYILPDTPVILLKGISQIFSSVQNAGQII